MPHDHRMNPVGSNHRPTPRIAKAMSLWWNRQRTPEEMQNRLNSYRDLRDQGVFTDKGSVVPSEVLSAKRTANVIAGRRPVSNDPAPPDTANKWDDGGKSSYLFDY